MGTLEIDELVGTAGISPKAKKADPAEVGKAAPPVFEARGPASGDALRGGRLGKGWSDDGVELVQLLRAQAITPQEVSRLVVDEDGLEMTIISAIEQGKIPPYDAPAVCATYPGEGWRYDSDRFCWERPLPIHVLARIVRHRSSG